MMAPVDTYGQDNGAALQELHSDALVLLKTQSIAELHIAIEELEVSGLRVLHVFPPQTLIGSAPAEIEPALLKHGQVLAIHRAPLEPPEAEGALGNARLGIQAWNRLAMSAAAASSHGSVQGQPLVGDAFLPPLTETPGQPRNAAPSSSGSARPDSAQTSEFMIGKVAVGVILPESTGTGENWTSSRQDQVIQEITAGCNWWATTGGTNAHLTFYYDIHRSVATQYEPIQRPRTDDGLWIGETLTNLGQPGPSYWTQCRNYDNAIRDQFRADWTFTIFVVDSLNDADGKFSDGKYFAYAYFGGPFLVMTYDNENWGMNRMNAVTSHEIGHIFGAADEYCDLGYSCCDFGDYGYLAVRNGNCETNNPGSVVCMMRRNSAALCTYTRGQIGWRDSDGDGIFDPADTPVSITLNRAGGTSFDAFTGTATDTAYPSPTQRPCTINWITGVEYRVDGGTWLPATPGDGAFDGPEESFVFAVCPGAGSHTVEARARNSVGNEARRTNSWSIPGGIIYVDSTYTGSPQNGSLCAPFRTVTQGYQAAHNHDIIRVSRGSYCETLTLTKLLRLEATNGIVNIGCR